MAKTWTFSYQDPIEGKNTGRYKYINGIAKLNGKSLTFKNKQILNSIDHQKPVKHEIEES